jgi:hypothetical protein
MPVRKNMTKAMLETENKRLRRERDAARKELADRKARETGPSSVSLSHGRLEMACKAMSQVTKWGRDVRLDEKEAMIVQQQALIKQKDEEIARLRRGCGPIGEVLLDREEQLARFQGIAVSGERQEFLLSKKMTVIGSIDRVQYAMMDLESVLCPRSVR